MKQLLRSYSLVELILLEDESLPVVYSSRFHGRSVAHWILGQIYIMELMDIDHGKAQQ